MTMIRIRPMSTESECGTGLGVAPLSTTSSLARMFDELWNAPFPFNGHPFLSFDLPTRRAFPPMNIWSDGNAVHVEAELPGFNLNDVEITLEGDTLTIKGRRGEQTEQEDVRFIRRERVIGEFVRSVRLSDPIDAEGVTARMQDGVLRITLPKVAAARPRTITISQN
jgi:HSP20 family protein